jgi:raffinose/stachyose/melibiose transport system permease protein
MRVRARRPERAVGQRAWVPFAFLAPTLLMYAVFAFAPIAHTVWLSFFAWDGITVGEWVGLDNYADILSDQELRRAFGHSAVMLVFYCVLPVGIGLVLAAILARTRLRGMTVFRAALFVPYAVATVVVAIAWSWIYSDGGTINSILRTVGLDGVTRAWLGDFGTALPALGLVGTWTMLGLCMVLFLAGIQKIPQSLYDAARVDGAGPIREFAHVTVPGLRGELAVTVTITTILALRSFDLVFVATGGGPGTATTVPAFELYIRAFQTGRVGQAAAIGVVITLLVFAAVLVIFRVFERRHP